MNKYIAILLLAFSGSAFTEDNLDVWVTRTNVDLFTDKTSYAAVVTSREYKDTNKYAEYHMVIFESDEFKPDDQKIIPKGRIAAIFKVDYYEENFPGIEVGDREIRMRIDKNEPHNIPVFVNKDTEGEAIEVYAIGLFTCDLVSELASGNMMIFELGEILKLPLKGSRTALMNAVPKCFNPERQREAYALAIKQKIERNWRQPQGLTEMPDCEVRVTQGPGGIILDVSFGACQGGSETYRSSIKNAIYKADPLPKPADPSLFERELIILFNPS